MLNITPTGKKNETNSFFFSVGVIKWKNKGYYIICIDTEIIESNIIKVRFYGKGSKKTKMLLDEFIDLVSSFDDNEEVKTVNLNNNTTYDNEGGCIIM